MDLHPVPGLHGPRTADNDLCIGVQRTTDGGGGIARFHHRDRQRYYDILLTQDCGFLFDSQHIAAGIIFILEREKENYAMRILLIEDDRALCTALLPALQAAGYTVDTCHDGADGKALLCGGAYDVCVLDRMLPGLDGLSLLRAARAKGCTTPVLMLTALSGINDRVDGLDAGADDYLGKPFDTRELLARLRALTRRPGTTAESAIRCGDVTLDAAQLTLSGPKAAAALTKREADLLEVLLRTPGQLQTRAVLLARVWGPLAEVEDANLDCYIHFVRRRLKAVGSAVTITTVRGSGYKAEVPPC